MEFLRNTSALNALFYEGRKLFCGLCAHTWLQESSFGTEVFPKQIPRSSAEFMNLLDKLPYRQTITT